jgi:hypothetical protein
MEMLNPKCSPRCRLENLTGIGMRKNPLHPKSSDYTLLGCLVCGTLWEFRPEYEVEDRFGGGPAKQYEISEKEALAHYPDMYKDDFMKVLAAKKSSKHIML